MERWQIVALILLIYLGVTLFIGLVAGGKASRSVTGYVAGDRRFGLLVMFFITGATIFSAFAFLGGPGWAYSRGAAAFYILAYGALGIAPWFWIAPRAARVGRRRGYVTQAQLLVGRFPCRFLSVLVACLTMVAFIPYITLQIRGAGIVIEAVTDGHIPLAAGSALAYGIVVFYVLRSGVTGVGWTNTFQGMFMLAVAWVLGLYLPTKLYGGVGPMFERIFAERPELLTVPGLDAAGEPWTWGAYSTAILVSAVGFTMWPHLFMKAFTARDDRILRRTVVLFPLFQLFLIPVFLIGFAGVLFPSRPDSPDFILPFMILETDLPALVVGLFCAGALAASMSTGDALLHASASIAVEDGIRPFLALSDGRRRLLMRLLVVVVGGVSFFFALDDSRSLVVLLLTSYGVVAQLAPPVLAALYWRRATTPGAVAGLLAGSAVTLYFFLHPELRPLDLHEGILGLLVHLPVLVGVSLATQAQPPEHSGEFVDR